MLIQIFCLNCIVTIKKNIASSTEYRKQVCSRNDVTSFSKQVRYMLGGGAYVINTLSLMTRTS